MDTTKLKESWTAGICTERHTSDITSPMRLFCSRATAFDPMEGRANLGKMVWNSFVGVLPTRWDGKPRLLAHRFGHGLGPECIHLFSRASTLPRMMTSFQLLRFFKERPEYRLKRGSRRSDEMRPTSFDSPSAHGHNILAIIIQSISVPIWSARLQLGGFLTEGRISMRAPRAARNYNVTLNFRPL
jgi:hypothetical protein